MSLETATYIDSLVVSNPDGTDARNTADDHLRLIKAALKRTFPMVGGAISASAAALCYVNDVTSPVQAQFNALRDGSATALNALYANSASFASNATSANFATSAAQATLAITALSASLCTVATYANSASYAALAGAATTATTASNANALGGAAPAAYALLAAPQSFGAGQAVTQKDSTGPDLTPNCDQSTMFRHTVNLPMTVSTPTAPRSGMVISLHFIQDGTGGHTIAGWSNVYKFAAGVIPTLTQAPGGTDVFAFQYDSTSGHWRQSGLNVS